MELERVVEYTTRGVANRGDGAAGDVELDGQEVPTELPVVPRAPLLPVDCVMSLKPKIYIRNQGRKTPLMSYIIILS